MQHGTHFWFDVVELSILKKCAHVGFVIKDAALAHVLWFDVVEFQFSICDMVKKRLGSA